LTTGRGDIIVYVIDMKVPDGKNATYIRVVCADRPEKAIAERVRRTVGGDRVQYDGSTNTETADLITVKTLINSTTSTPNARAVCFDLKDFYLGTPMSEHNKYTHPHRHDP
jgi:hypothetical protein